MIKNIIFDLGNVLLNFKPRQFLLRFTQDRARIETFVSKIIGTETWLKMDRGIISQDEALDFFLKNYPEEADLLIPFFEHCWEMLTPIQENVSLLPKLKQNDYKLYVLSNFIREAFIFVKNKYDFFEIFDGIVLSFKIHYIKPEKEIYQFLINKYNLIPNESLFIDDSPECVKTAASLGIKGILYHEKLNLLNEFKNFDIVIN